LVAARSLRLWVASDWTTDAHGDCRNRVEKPENRLFSASTLRWYALCIIAYTLQPIAQCKEITMRYFIAAALLFVGCTENKNPSTSGTSTTGTPTTVTANKPVDRDNTAVNARDRDRETKTPIDQNENKDDVKKTADIRKAVVDTKMSTDAHNVKIITQDGKVTLRGPVKSEDEKRQIEEIAVRFAGDGNVINEIEVEVK
jgi:hypothetical protein